MNMKVEPTDAPCGAHITGVDLSRELDREKIAAIRAAWLKHKVIAFPDQHLDDDALERFTLTLGEFGVDPFFAPIPGRENIAAILREADETTPLFAESWHSDWSFLPRPPAGTCLAAVEIPPVGGDTLFADQVAAFDALPAQRKDYLRSLTTIHSASRGYAPSGLYGENDEGRSMAIRPSEEALKTQTHPLITTHPETGEETIFCSLSYVVGIEGIDEMEAMQFVVELSEWQTRDEFVYRHKWQPGMVILWDNRSVLHKATGGYEGHRRELHRTTIAAPALG
ncbi:TauD/TfdA family dioxygenase [Altererythrobacter aquaemixtae]|uniref:TauD/TfdA family dioxygenase n=2 Tax=Pontixanthobacter aquaemixtae TaxID=1958940 RepID=A0A844ZXS4_9SPHN|nr:TauD/TfdA family dioxygenase [Pontixanthobacter aquaemixtae]